MYGCEAQTLWKEEENSLSVAVYTIDAYQILAERQTHIKKHPRKIVHHMNSMYVSQPGLSLRRERSLSLASAHALNAPGERLTARLKMLSSEYSDHEYLTQPALRHHGNKPFMKAMCCPHCLWSGCRIYSTIKCLPAFKLIKIWSYLDIYPPSPFVCIDMSYGRTHHLHMSGYSLPSALF